MIILGPVNLDDILITTLNQIELSGGNLLHAIKIKKKAIKLLKS